MRYPISTVFFIVVILFFADASTAHGLDIRTSSQDRLDFSLIISQNNFRLQNAEYSLDTDFLSFGFQVIDVSPYLPVHIGLGVGYAFVDQQQISDLNNANLSGVYANLLARTTLFTKGPVALFFNAHYAYVSVQNNMDEQKTRLRWNHYMAELKLNYALGHYFSMDFGGVYGHIDATLSGSGQTDLYERLDTSTNTAGIIGINYHVDENQKLSVTLQQGYNDNFVIQFQRTFF